MKMNPVVHFEMPAEDKARMVEFYSSVFGWKAQQMGADMGDYVVVQTDETDEKGMLKETNRINGGFYKKGQGDTAPHIVIAVEDLDKHIDMVKAAGGKTAGDPMDIPGIGKFVMIMDTEGNKVGLLQPSGSM